MKVKKLTFNLIAWIKLLTFLSFYFLRASTSVDAKFCMIEKTPHFTHFDLKNTYISGCKIVHLCTSATVTVHICMATVPCVFNILHFFLSPSPHSLSFSLLPLSRFISPSFHQSVQPHPQSTDQFTDHRYPTYGDHHKSLELSRTTKL